MITYHIVCCLFTVRAYQVGRVLCICFVCHLLASFLLFIYNSSFAIFKGFFFDECPLVAFLSLLFLLMMNNEISCVPVKTKSILYFCNHLICVDGLFSDTFILEYHFFVE